MSVFTEILTGLEFKQLQVYYPQVYPTDIYSRNTFHLIFRNQLDAGYYNSTASLECGNKTIKCVIGFDPKLSTDISNS